MIANGFLKSLHHNVDKMLYLYKTMHNFLQRQKCLLRNVLINDVTVIFYKLMILKIYSITFLHAILHAIPYNSEMFLLL